MNPPLSQPAERWNNRALWRLIWPLVIEQLLAVTIGMADTVMVASVGEAAVSGISLVDTINVLLITAFSALATGGAVVVSQYLGRREAENASLAARQLVYCITAVSLFIMAVTLIFRRALLSLIYGHIEAPVMQAGETYFWLSALSYPFLALYNAGAALFRSMGNSRISMLTSAIVNLINIGGNALLIFGFGWGVAGAGTATLVSRMAAAAVVMGLLLRRRPGMFTLAGIFNFKLDFPMIRSILRIGVPSGLENSMFQVGKLLVARLISTLGTFAIAGNAIANNIATFGNVPGNAIGLALLTVVGQCIGAKDYVGARRYTAKLMKFTWLSMAGTGVLLVLLAKPIIGMFGLSAEAAAIAYECTLLSAVLSAVFWPQSFALPNALRAAGDARYTMVVSMFSMWTFRIGLSFVFAGVLGWGVLGVWAAMVVDWVVRGTFFLLRWRSGKWETKRVI